MFVWTKKYSVGIQELDEQHRQFLAIVNEVLDVASIKNISRVSLLATLDKFLNYALYHLATEEDHFARFDCPPPGHIEAHDNFRAKFKELYMKAREGDDATRHLCAEVAARFAGQWLLDHILFMDKKYTECFHEHGLQ